MEKIKKNLPIILVSLSSILFVVAILLLVSDNVFKSSNNVNSNNTNSNDTKIIDDKKNSSEENNTNTSTENNNSSSVEPTSTPVVTPTPTSTPSDTKETRSEEAVIKFFQTRENEVQAGDEKTLSEKAKDAFVTVVDFIFYGKEIKGYTFKELTTTAKLKIITIALKIDSKIDSYFPNYKDKIKGTYTNIKAKLVEKYLEYTDKLCETVGSETCESAKESWENLKKNFSITGEYLKNLGITGTDKLKSWYENFRDN